MNSTGPVVPEFEPPEEASSTEGGIQGDMEAAALLRKRQRWGIANRWALLTFLALLLVISVSAWMEPSLPAGTPLPAFEAMRLSGQVVGPDALAGKVAVVQFWATWCGPCVEEMPAVIDVVKAFPATQVEFLAISRDEGSDALKAVQQFALEKAPELLLFAAMDRNTTAFGVEVLPTTYVFDRRGRMAYARAGRLDLAQFRLALEEAVRKKAD